ncbi:MAG: YlzJ-like family protein [Bacillota bacterium]
MILYTIMPPESILEGYDTFKPEYIELDYPGGGKMVIEPLSQSEGRLVRLISPCPDDYLRPENQPGTIISFKPVHP